MEALRRYFQTQEPKTSEHTQIAEHENFMDRQRPGHVPEFLICSDFNVEAFESPVSRVEDLMAHSWMATRLFNLTGT